MKHTLETRRPPLRSGFTLVEVAVAMAIFIFGAIAIIRIFPPALGVITNSGDRTTAITLNRSTLNRFESQPGSVPDAVYNLDSSRDWTTESDGAWDDFTGSTVGTVNRGASIPRDRSQASFNSSALSKFRHVIGERQKIATTGTQAFVLTQFPISDGGLTNKVGIYEEDFVDGVAVDPNGYLDFSNATFRSSGASLSDVSNPERPSDTGRDLRTNCVYYVTYKWLQNNRLQGVVEEPVGRFPVDASWDATLSGRVRQGILLTNQVVPGIVGVYFRRRITTIPITVSSQNGAVGYVPVSLSDQRFIPNPPANLVPGDVVSLDYDVRDWRWIVSESTPALVPDDSRTVPEFTTDNNDRALSLPIRQINNENGLPLYTLLQEPTTTVGTFNLFPAQWNGAAATPTPTAGYLRGFNRRTNQVVFDDINTPTLRSARARVVYRTMDQWTHQVAVAARSYKPFFDTSLTEDETVPSEPWRDYARPKTSNPLIADDTDPYLYFYPSEAGKAILVTYTYGDPTAAASSDTMVTAKILTVDDKLVDAPSNMPTGFVGASGKVARVALTDNNGDALGGGPKITAIVSVQGLSVQARTAWLNGSTWTQSSITSYRETS